MKKLKYLIPAAFIFSTPWVHKLIFNNILLAWPEADPGGAHFFAIMSSVIAVLLTLFLVNE